MILHRVGIRWLLLLGAWLLAGCAPAYVPEPAERLDAADIAMGSRAYAEMLNRFPEYRDAAVQRYVRAVGARLVAVSPVRANVKLRFTVLDSPGVFAYSFAQGDVVIGRGLLVHLNSEAQLAAVLAHEIGHVVSLHQKLQWQEARKAQELEARLSAHLGSDEGREVLSALSLARVRGYSRETEIEADVWSERLLARAGYDTGAMAQVMRLFVQLETFWEKQGFELWEIPEFGGGEGVFATHPSVDRRLEQAVQRQGRAAQAAAAPDTAYLHALHGVLFGLPERYGVQRGNAFVHPVARVAFSVPADWYLFGANDRLVAAPRGRDGMLVIRMAAPESAETRRHALERLADGYPLESVVPYETTTVQGEMAVARTGSGNERRSVRLAVLDVGGQRLHVAGFTFTPERWAETDVQFRGLLKSVRVLPEAEARRARPLRLKIVQPRAAGAFTPSTQAFGDHPRERWQLLNQVYPQGRIPAGQPIKAIE